MELSKKQRNPNKKAKKKLLKKLGKSQLKTTKDVDPAFNESESSADEG